jgi:tetratricopeptide (TPR) repeat protein
MFPAFLVRIVYVDDFFDYAEHRAYLPMIGILFVLIEMLKANEINFDIKEFFAKGAFNIKKGIAIGLAIAILIGLTMRADAYKVHFQNRTTFWQHMVDMYPYKSRGYLDLGKAYFAKDSLDKAEKLYHMGIERNPNNKNLYIDLSVIYLRKNEILKAKKYAETALSIDPNDAIANYNLGKASYMSGDFASAANAYEKACRYNPTVPQWYVDLGVAYYQIRQLDKSIRAYQIAIQMMPNFALAYSNLGATLALAGKTEEASQYWLKAISVDPKTYDAYLNLIRYYISIQKPDKARNLAISMKQNGGQFTPDIQQNLQQLGINF